MLGAIYGRVSTNKQVAETQLLPPRDFCREHKIKVFKEYVDVGVSGAKESRPQLNRLLDDMRIKKFEVIVIYRLDRIARSLSHLLNLFQEFRNRKVRLISLADNIDTFKADDPVSKAFWQLLGVFSELEKEIIRGRVISGLERAKRAGVKLGRRLGSKDKRPRATSGYKLRYAGIKKKNRQLGKR
ncbi:MAG: recombinase family protein [Candidatus Omnitrophica bacterium]|nr:recombinase family protein [Candidatus Omnitrophota bacterium]